MGGGIVAERIGGELLMTSYLATDTDLTAVASAIRTKGGTSAALSWPTGFVSAVNAIPSGGGGANTCTMTVTDADPEGINVICSSFSSGAPSGTFVAIAVCEYMSYDDDVKTVLVFVGTAGQTELVSDQCNTSFFVNDAWTTTELGQAFSRNRVAIVGNDFDYCDGSSETAFAYIAAYLGTYTATVIEV